jgi:hypothetical protein
MIYTSTIWLFFIVLICITHIHYEWKQTSLKGKPVVTKLAQLLCALDTINSRVSSKHNNDNTIKMANGRQKQQHQQPCAALPQDTPSPGWASKSHQKVSLILLEVTLKNQYLTFV